MVRRERHKTTDGTKNQFTCGAFGALLYQYPTGKPECDEGDSGALKAEGQNGGRAEEIKGADEAKVYSRLEHN